MGGYLCSMLASKQAKKYDPFHLTRFYLESLGIKIILEEIKANMARGRIFQEYMLK